MTEQCKQEHCSRQERQREPDQRAAASTEPFPCPLQALDPKGHTDWPSRGSKWEQQTRGRVTNGNFACPDTLHVSWNTAQWLGAARAGGACSSGSLGSILSPMKMDPRPGQVPEGPSAAHPGPATLCISREPLPGERARQQLLEMKTPTSTSQTTHEKHWAISTSQQWLTAG